MFENLRATTPMLESPGMRFSKMPFLCKQSKQSGQKSFPDTLSDLSLLHIRSNARDKVKDNSVLP